MFVFFRLFDIAITFLVTDHLSLNRPAAGFSPPPIVSVDGGSWKERILAKHRMELRFSAYRTQPRLSAGSAGSHRSR
jgi:hypothetical protein